MSKQLRDFINSPWYRKNAAPFAVGLCLGLLGLYLFDRIVLR